MWNVFALQIVSWTAPFWRRPASYIRLTENKYVDSCLVPCFLMPRNHLCLSTVLTSMENMETTQLFSFLFSSLLFLSLCFSLPFHSLSRHHFLSCDSLTRRKSFSHEHLRHLKVHHYCHRVKVAVSLVTPVCLTVCVPVTTSIGVVVPVFIFLSSLLHCRSHTCAASTLVL